MLAPPWMIWFFFLSHLAMWIVSFGQTFWIVHELKKELTMRGLRKRK
jgi:hypothetical protein